MRVTILVRPEEEMYAFWQVRSLYQLKPASQLLLRGRTAIYFTCLSP